MLFEESSKSPFFSPSCEGGDEEGVEKQDSPHLESFFVLHFVGSIQDILSVYCVLFTRKGEIAKSAARTAGKNVFRSLFKEELKMVTTNSSVQDLVVRVSELIRDTESKEVDVLRLTKETVVSAIRVLGPVVKYIEQEYTEMEPGFKFQTSVRGIYLGTYQLRHPEHDYVEDFPAFLVHGGNVRILSRENSLLASWISAQPDDCKESLGDFVESLSEDELSEVLETVHQSLLNAEAKLQDRLQKLQERERKIQTTRDMLNS